MALRNFTSKPTLCHITTALNGTDAPGTSTTVTVDDVTNLPSAPFTGGLDLHQTTEEVVLVTAVNTSTKVLTITRGYDGTAVSAHAANTGTFEHTTAAIDFREANAHVNAGVSAGHGQVQTADIANAAVGQTQVNAGYVDLLQGQTVGGPKNWSAAQTFNAAVTFNSTQNLLVPGAVTLFAGAAAPGGWLICDGSAVSRTTYAALFAAIGTTFGAGDGSTTFNLPNLKGRVPVGLDAGQTEFDVLGETGGEKTHTLTTAEMPSHNHTTGTTSSAHTHAFGIEWAANTTATGASTRVGDIENLTGGGGTNATATANTTGSTHTHNVNNTGGDGAHNNLQPYIAMNYIIKT